MSLLAYHVIINFLYKLLFAYQKRMYFINATFLVPKEENQEPTDIADVIVVDCFEH